ncbi:MAG: phosphoribosylformylglycinamidine synthase subunit PurS [Coriobacteriales bacterium]|jgi:phosphoribosylformylglycinamidine synthase|nr:phosphoribosylformylglycinamidine synthase subunit PurS [Coriobacteriales bacterium]
MRHYQIHVTAKKGIFDPAGTTAQHALENLGYDGVRGVKIGKLIELAADDSVTADEVAQMCARLLANPVIEDFDIKEA